MKKKRVIFYSIILLVLVVFVGVGVIGFISKDTYKNNNITFVVDSLKAYSRIQGKYYYNGQELTNKAYDEKYTEEDEYSKDGTKSFKQWDIGESAFTGETNTETFSYEITITNLNREHALAITLSDVAVGEDLVYSQKEVYFYTTIAYQLSGQSSQVMFSNVEGQEINYSLFTLGTKKVAISTPQQIGVNQSLTITIQIQRKTKVNSFDFVNNFKINLSALEN